MLAVSGLCRALLLLLMPAVLLLLLLLLLTLLLLLPLLVLELFVPLMLLTAAVLLVVLLLAVPELLLLVASGKKSEALPRQIGHVRFDCKRNVHKITNRSTHANTTIEITEENIWVTYAKPFVNATRMKLMGTGQNAQRLSGLKVRHANHTARLITCLIGRNRE